MALEDRYVTATPEGVSLDVVLAGLGSRIAAYLIDALIQLAVIIGVTVAIGAISGPVPSQTTGLVAGGVFALLLIGTLIGYFVVFEMLSGGRSIGKRAVGLRVVRTDGAPLGFWSSLLRNVLRLVDVLPTAYLVGSVLVLATPRNQRLGDLVAGTLVVRERTAAQQRLQQVGWHDPTQWSGVPAAGWPPIPPPGGGWAPAPGPGAWAPVPGPGGGWAPAPGGPGGWPAPGLPPALAHWDVSGVGDRELQLARLFLANRWGYTPEARWRLAQRLAAELWPLVAGAPAGLPPEQFLEGVVTVKAARG